MIGCAVIPFGQWRNQVYQKDFYIELESCRTSGLTCTIDNTVLQASPYSLADKDIVEAKVLAINVFGESAQSLQGSGGSLPGKPDAPAAPTTKDNDLEIEISWVAPFDGQSPILDYLV